MSTLVHYYLKYVLLPGLPYWELEPKILLATAKLFSRHVFHQNIAETDSVTSHLQQFSKKIIFMTKTFSIKTAHVISTCCTRLTAVGYGDLGHLLLNFLKPYKILWK